MHAHAIPQVDADGTGVHLAWSGPASWVYAPSGWTVQRRPARPPRAVDCEHLNADTIAELRLVRERRLGFGSLTLRDGAWLGALDVPGLPAAEPVAEVFRVDLDGVRRVARATATAKLSLLTALYEGRVVGVAGPAAGPAGLEVRATRIDAFTVTTVEVEALVLCVDVPAADEAAEWRDVPPLVTGLQLPFRELMPGLADGAAELAEARSRLRLGEDLDPESFGRLARALRPVLRAAGPPRPAELVLLLRETEADDADQARGLDPVRVLLAHPTWRRALGFAIFDDDPALVVGTAYEYRVSATFPAADVADANHGFATVPAGTLLPVDFSVGTVRFRVPQPVTVTLDPGTADAGLVRVTRRGIALDSRRDDHWLHPGLDGWSLVVDFPVPVPAVVLELAPGHALEWASGPAFGPFPVTDPVPSGPRPRLVLPAPADQLRLRGTGFLHAVRASTLPEAATAGLSVVTPPVVLADTPLPAPPFHASAASLQRPAASLTSTLGPPGPARPALGFTVRWRPVPAFGLTGWPADADAAPPLDATIFQVERRAEPAGPWLPVLEDENWTLGDRDQGVRDLALVPGSDVLAAFPEQAGQPTGGTLDLTLVDTFVDASGTPDPPLPGGLHRYRVRAVDPVGRPSPAWTETDPVRLEKHVPPPVPVGPDEVGTAAPEAPLGVQARVLVRGADDLTAAEEALLGGAGTAVVLRWGWHAGQREQDPLATEFRVYAAPPLDAVTGTVTGVTTLGAGTVASYRVDLQLDRPVAADAAAGLRLDAGHPFYVRTHTSGTSVQMTVETRLLTAAGTPPVPAPGPVRLSLPLTPDRASPRAWSERVTVVPVTPATAYQVVLSDRLAVDAEHRADTLWVGVSAADDQAYVADQRAPAESRPGNESAVVPAVATARFAGRPTLEVPPPLDPVPVVRTPEPGTAPVRFALDLTAHLPPEALAAGRVRHERVAARLLVAACAATADGRVVGRPVEPLAPGDAEQEIPVPNPVDRAALVVALRSGRSAAVEDRFCVYLAGRHPFRDRLFAAAHPEPRPPGPFPEELPPAPERWLYRVRAVDAAGHVSAGSATVRAVVRVPSLLAGPMPLRLPREDADAPDLLRVAVPADPATTHLLVFHAPSVGVGPVTSGELIRVPNRPDLLPAGGCWLPAPDGVLLTPTATDLAGPLVVVTADGTRQVAVDVPGGPGARTRVWLASLTRDGIPSPVAGPYTVLGAAPVAPARA